jgi:hypothetical protein
MKTNKLGLFHMITNITFIVAAFAAYHATKIAKSLVVNLRQGLKAFWRFC